MGGPSPIAVLLFATKTVVKAEFGPLLAVHPLVHLHSPSLPPPPHPPLLARTLNIPHPPYLLCHPPSNTPSHRPPPSSPRAHSFNTQYHF
ncbi:hypothetical protein ACTXT7_010878 [Hymenolepis weldensis]